jgi:hypothetical protein
VSIELHQSWRKASNQKSPAQTRDHFAPEFRTRKALLDQGFYFGTDFPCEHPECEVCLHQFVGGVPGQVGQSP